MKYFLVINTSFFGDVLLTDPLCRSIKIEYPDSKIVFIVNRPFYEVAKYMDGVDEVLCYDKKGAHKGFMGFVHFYRENKARYKNKFEAAFVIYGNERGIILAKLFGAKKIYSDHQGLLKYLLERGKLTQLKHTQDRNCALLGLYTEKKTKSIPMLYQPPKSASEFIDQLFKEKSISECSNLIAICTTSKRKDKDMPVEECTKLINALEKMGKKILFVGAGQVALNYVKDLHALNCTNFIDLTNKTTISQLAEVLKRCKVVISVDTGTLHLTCAVGVPLLALFYVHSASHLKSWAPKDFYPHRLMTGDHFTTELMLENINILGEKSSI